MQLELLCVNALGGLFSFLRGLNCQFSKELTGVNALGGLFSFLRTIWNYKIDSRLMVSMPSAGYSHFYRYDIEEPKIPKKGVNALGGLFSFLQPSLNIYWMTEGTVCQCPRRAILISTDYQMKCNFHLDYVSMPSAGYSHFY